jgi:hypothetical protein
MLLSNPDKRAFPIFSAPLGYLWLTVLDIF